jgi:hypothetical protein
MAEHKSRLDKDMYVCFLEQKHSRDVMIAVRVLFAELLNKDILYSGLFFFTRSYKNLILMCVRPEESTFYTKLEKTLSVFKQSLIVQRPIRGIR